jgi:DNA-binding PadR family transcriptional regulator
MEFNHNSLKKHKEAGIVSLFVLHSLSNSPKSGYDLINEISGITKGKWIPSKGTIYPILKKMEQNLLIKVTKVYKRSRKVFDNTEKGNKYFKKILESQNSSKDAIFKMRSIFAEIFNENCRFYLDDLIEINKLTNLININKSEKVSATLKQCILELEALK